MWFSMGRQLKRAKRNVRRLRLTRQLLRCPSRHPIPADSSQSVNPSQSWLEAFAHGSAGKGGRAPLSICVILGNFYLNGFGLRLLRFGEMEHEDAVFKHRLNLRVVH